MGMVTMVRLYEVGDRVKLHPATNYWMRGDRYGEVVHFGSRTNTYKIKLDSGRFVRTQEKNILERVWGTDR